ncbi:MAG: hypothetical protein NWF03_04555 [Candidatus Bathyarchaeota archaeon]|nr:hypothetical protein [Candidatus Bathyarchaeota archaeon]
MNEGMNEMKNTKPIGDKDEPFFYMAFVLKGTSDQYLDLLKYAKKQNGAKIIYQNRSLTYLYISNEDPTKSKQAVPEFTAEQNFSKKL